MLSYSLSLRLIALSHGYHYLTVQPIVSRLPQWRISFSKWLYHVGAHRVIGLLDRVQVNAFEVVSCLYPDDRISLLRPIVPTKQKLSTVEKTVKKTKNILENLRYNPLIVDVSFLYRSCFAVSLKVILWRNGKKGKKDACMVWRLCLIVEWMFLKLKYTGHFILWPK